MEDKMVQVNMRDDLLEKELKEDTVHYKELFFKFQRRNEELNKKVGNSLQLSGAYRGTVADF